LLDVHSIHAPVRAWRDFLIHIAIIVVGLCIAVGIQQTVEFVHHRHQLTELRQALRLEREDNHKTLTANTSSWRWGTAELQNNLLVFQYLQHHPGTPQENLPGVLLWANSDYEFGSAAWDAAHQSGLRPPHPTPLGLDDGANEGRGATYMSHGRTRMYALGLSATGLRREASTNAWKAAPSASEG